jgi:serine protease AprX
MRYFIKAYPMHETEVHALDEEAATGGVDADIHDGLVVGTADEAAIARLTAKGVVVQALGIVSAAQADEPGDDDAAEAHRFGGRAPAALAETLGARATETGAALPRAPGVPSYWLADLLTGLTDETIGALAEAGAEIVERDPSGAFVLRSKGSVSDLRRILFVRRLRPYGVVETMPAPRAALTGTAAGTTPPTEFDVADDEASPAVAGARGPGLESFTSRGEPALGDSLSSARFEAICHEPSDRAEVTEAIGALGGRIIASTGRAVRFILNPADVASVAAIPEIASVAAARSPQLRCDVARPLIGLEQAGPPPRILPYDGGGELIGVADTGIDAGHPDFAAKRVTAIALGRLGDSSDPDGHGTHVAGTIAGDGTASRLPGSPPTSPAPLRGIAPAADLYVQSILDANGGLGGLPDSLIDLLKPAYDAGVRVHNNSWGEYIQSRYDSMALDIDEFVHEHPDFLPVIAAGNEGSCRPGLSSTPGFVDYPSLGSPATAKNGITVGASRSSRTSGGLAAMTWQQAWPQDFDAAPIAGATVSGNPSGLAAFSSRGPCDDFRIKPDLVAPGTDIAATRSSAAPLSHFWGAYPHNRFYAFLGGTSMACPIVAGCAALARQYYRTEHAGFAPSAALLKATLINGTTLLDGQDAVAPPDGRPNYHQGFGRVDLAHTLPDPRAPAFDLFFVDTWQRDPAFRFISRKGRFRWEFDVQTACELRITLVWTDYPGRGLQNQLRIILDTRRRGETVNWVGNADAVTPLQFPSHDPTALLPGQDRVLTRDPQNNVQIIRAQVEPGSHMLALFADGLIKLPQDFALVATYGVGAINVEAA